MKKNYFLILCIFYFATRLAGIFLFPIFTDEILYARWIQEIQDGYLFRPLDNGRQPLFIWIATFINFLFNQEFVSLRIVSVIAGFISLIGIKKLTYILFKNENAALFSAIIYIVLPLSFIHDILGILDSMVTAISIWALIFALELIRKPKFFRSLKLGLILGLGLITKSNVLLSIVMLPFSLLIRSDLIFRNKRIILPHQIKKLLFLLIFSVVVAKFIELILVVQPNYFRILASNGIFVFPIREWINLSLNTRLDIFIANFLTLSKFLLGYLLTLFITLLFIPLYFKTNSREKLLLFLNFFIPFLLLCIFGRVLFSRYILPMVIFLIPLFAILLYELIEKFKNKFITICVILIFILMPAYSSFILFFNYEKSFIPRSDKQQYFISSKVFVWLEKEFEKIVNAKNTKKILLVNQTDSLAYRSLAEIFGYKNQSLLIINSKDEETVEDNIFGNVYLLTNQPNANNNYKLHSSYDDLEVPLYIYKYSQ